AVVRGDVVGLPLGVGAGERADVADRLEHFGVGAVPSPQLGPEAVASCHVRSPCSATPGTGPGNVGWWGRGRARRGGARGRTRRPRTPERRAAAGRAAGRGGRGRARPRRSRGTSTRCGARTPRSTPGCRGCRRVPRRLRRPRRAGRARARGPRRTRRTWRSGRGRRSAADRRPVAGAMPRRPSVADPLVDALTDPAADLAVRAAG